MTPTPDACRSVGHPLNAVGTEVSVEVVVTDRRHDLDVNKFGYMNQVGEAAGRDSKQHELHTRARIEAMRKEDSGARRERRINTKMRDRVPISSHSSDSRKKSDEDSRSFERHVGRAIPAQENDSGTKLTLHRVDWDIGHRRLRDL
jgi:hypothetical protein